MKTTLLSLALAAGMPQIRRIEPMKTNRHKLLTDLTTSLCAALAGSGMVGSYAHDSLPFPFPPMGGKNRTACPRTPPISNIQGEPL